jgi:hypothetical protein
MMYHAPMRTSFDSRRKGRDELDHEPGSKRNETPLRLRLRPSARKLKLPLDRLE